jgi:outer membrane protein assembly factor BamB
MTSIRSMSRTFVVGLWAVALSLAVATVAQAADWPQWRGPDSNCITPDSSGWAAGAVPQKLWSKNVGRGGTAPIIVAGKVYAMGWLGNDADAVYAFDARTGEELWKQSYVSRERTRNHNADEGNYGGPLATPTFDAATGYLYTLGCDGDLKCWDTAKKGALVWGRNLFTELGVKPRGGHDYGFTASPLVLGDVVICEATAPAGTVTAFDKKTGAKRWSSAYKGSAGHSGGPAVLTADGTKCLAYLALHDVIVMDAAAGKTIGQVGWSTTYEANIPAPVAQGNEIFVTSSYGNKTKCFEVTASGLKEKWASPASAKVCAPVVYKGSVYVIDGRMRCLDAATGKVKWEGGDFGGGSSGNCLVAAGDNKIIAFGAGRLVLLDAAADKYAELARIDGLVPALCYPQVALSDRIIVCKDDKGAMVALSTGPAAATLKK